MDKLSAAFELFRRGLFSEARAAAIDITAEEPQNFWAFYLAAVSSAFQQELREFEGYLALLDEFETKNVYLNYLKAYYALLQRDVEKALWNYLEIADDPEGWLARSLIKKFRKIKELKNVEFRVADFIVLPAELPPPMQIKPTKGATVAPADSAPVTHKPPVAKGKAQRGWQFDNEGNARTRGLAPAFSRIRNTLANGRRVFLLISLLFIAVALVIFIAQNRKEKAAIHIPDLQIADSAAVMPVVADENVLQNYKSRDQVITDFERAKQLLRARKVNQSRYLLNRLVHSNADFQSREKSRVFLGFIQDPDFGDFNDNLTLKELFENVKLRQGSLIVASGELRDAAEENGGAMYQLIAREGGEEYRINAFRGNAVKEEKISSRTSPAASTAGRGQVQVYGRFKGLIGSQQAIYLEVLRVWR